MPIMYAYAQTAGRARSACRRNGHLSSLSSAQMTTSTTPTWRPETAKRCIAPAAMKVSLSFLSIPARSPKSIALLSDAATRRGPSSPIDAAAERRRLAPSAALGGENRDGLEMHSA